jgi:6-phosphogluconolactonase
VTGEPGASSRALSSVQVFSPRDYVARVVERIFSQLKPLTEGREARIGLSGGRTPGDVYRLIATSGLPVDWTAAHFFFADERDAPPTEPESNYWMARKLWFEPAGVPPAHVHRMKADSEDLEAAAKEYEALLEKPLDLLVLGIGEDGHTASLFPGSRWLEERERRVVPVYDSPKPPPRRLTITPRVIAEAREVVVLARGADKAKAVAAALADSGEVSRTPARLARDRWWLIDEAAAADLIPTP